MRDLDLLTERDVSCCDHTVLQLLFHCRAASFLIAAVPDDGKARDDGGGPIITGRCSADGVTARLVHDTI